MVPCLLASTIGAQASGLGLRVQFLAVATPQLVPTFHAMSEPLAHLRAWRYHLQPRVRLEVGFFHTSRSEASHENSPPIRSCRRIVRAFEPNGALKWLRAAHEHHPACLFVAWSIASSAIAEWA